MGSMISVMDKGITVKAFVLAAKTGGLLLFMLGPRSRASAFNAIPNISTSGPMFRTYHSGSLLVIQLNCSCKRSKCSP